MFRLWFCLLFGGHLYSTMLPPFCAFFYFFLSLFHSTSFHAKIGDEKRTDEKAEKSRNLSFFFSLFLFNSVSQIYKMVAPTIVE